VKSWTDLPSGPVVTCGEPLVAIVPSEPVPFHQAETLEPWLGGSELNVAVGIARLGQEAVMVTAVGEDFLGRRVLDALVSEGIDARYVRIDPERPTGLYLREWLPDGERRLVYYRAGSAASALAADDWPQLDRLPGWVHVTGLTAALGDGPAALVRRAVETTQAENVPCSIDPNYRPALADPGEAQETFAALAPYLDVVLLSTEDAEALFESADPETVCARLHQAGIELVVLKRGAAGAILSIGGTMTEFEADLAHPVDPVGAGDGFDAGFIAGLRETGSPHQACRLGSFVAARAVERPGEHRYPTRSELPPGLLGEVPA
jgi:2-dehydro-3-deoxygluconokinase